MEKDKLKDFILENKSAFETAKAPSNVWINLEKELSNKPKKTKTFWIIGLALFAFILITGIFISSVFYASKTDLQYASKDIEYQELEQFYGSKLNYKREEFQGQLRNTLVSLELNDLNKGYEELKKDFLYSDAENQELILSLMKENYELRIKIIELAMERSQVDSVPTIKNKNDDYKEY